MSCNSNSVVLVNIFFSFMFCDRNTIVVVNRVYPYWHFTIPVAISRVPHAIQIYGYAVLAGLASVVTPFKFFFSSPFSFFYI